MRLLTVFSLCAALCGAAQAVPAGRPAGPSQLSPGAELARSVEAAVGDVFAKTSPAVVRVESEDEFGKVAGTGFFADADGTVYTLSSVVGDGTAIMVTHADKKSPARLLAKDDRSGIALVKVESADPTPFLIKGDCANVQTATPLVVVGFPFDLAITPSYGVVGGLDRQAQGRFFATTHFRANIPVQRGQGGSPVLDLDGSVVGVLVSGFEGGSGCYILPMRAAEKALVDFARFGDVRHGWAGVTLQEISPTPEGARMAIDVIDPAGPAAQDFRTGDVVLQVGDITIRDPEDAVDAAFFLTAGQRIPVRVARDGEILEIAFTPGEHPLDRKPSMQALGPGSLMGVPRPVSAP
ncbi:MAG: S1C family serine protease [Chthoniobacterales bacterium]